MKLNDIAEFVTDKISSSGISLDRYVTTDSLLQNRRGREIAQNLPPMPCALTHYRQGDVLVANIRPYLKKVWYADSEGGCSSDVLAFRAKNGHCPSFLYTVLMQDAFFDYAMSGAKGSKMPRGDKDQIMRYELPTFTPLEEENIGNMMIDIMSKINVNRQINDNLEAMANQLYDYWFIQFDFPNEEGYPYKSSGGKMAWNEKLKREIPEGWNVVEFKDLIEANRGISYNSDTISGGGIPMINLASFNIDGTYKHSGIKTYNGSYSEDKILKPFDLVMCNTQQTAIDFSKDIIGKAFLVPFIFEGDVVSSHHVTTLTPKQKELKAYIAYLSNTKHFHKYVTGCCSGTNIMGINYMGLSQYKMEVPPLSILQQFESRIIQIEKRKGLIILENENLIKQRDELLPLLMNGQASVNYHLSDD